MKNLLVLVLVCAFAVGLVGNVRAGQYDNIVSAADVERATGLQGIKQVPRVKATDGMTANKLLTGDLNFVRQDGEPVLIIQFRPVFVYDGMKADSGYFKAAVPGIGDEAFLSPSFPPQNAVNIRKGSHVAVVTAHIDPKDSSKTIISLDQLTSVAKLVASRM